MFTIYKYNKFPYERYFTKRATFQLYAKSKIWNDISILQNPTKVKCY